MEKDIKCINSVESVIKMIKGKWSLLVIIALIDQTLRFNELKKAIDNVSTKSLSNTLRYLEKENMVIRTVNPTVPPEVSYKLTAKGKDFGNVLTAMKQWDENWKRGS